MLSRHYRDCDADGILERVIMAPSQATSLRDVIACLVSSEIIELATVARSRIEIINRSRRNQSFSIAVADQFRYFVKYNAKAQYDKRLSYEVKIYQRLWASEADPVTVHLPKLIHYDAENSIVVLEHLSNSRTLRDYHTHRNRFPKWIPKTLGRALALLHRQQIADDEGTRISRPPWILSSNRPSLELITQTSSAGIELVHTIQQFDLFAEAFSSISQQWQPRCLIHSDIKWDNIILFSSAANGRRNRLAIIDWEFAHKGDPFWDVGSLFCDYLHRWLTSIPITDKTPTAEMVSSARIPLEALQPSLKLFWESYVINSSMTKQQEMDALITSIRYSGARLVQTAFERCQAFATMDGLSVFMLQLAYNVLQAPIEAAVNLFGFSILESEKFAARLQ